MRDSFLVVDKRNYSLGLNGDLLDYLHGLVIPVDKPLTWTSADVVRKLKFKAQRFFNQRNIKIGHAGTLDPLATGLLLLCIGKATKISEKLQSQDKEYIANIEFGATTPSYDLEKEIDATYPYQHIDLDLLNSILPKMTGEIEQIPPIFSAKMIDGKRAYEIAREGLEVEMRPARVTISNLEIISFDSPHLKIKVNCSKGTYIRSFARDIGLAAESGAHLTGLIRRSSGIFTLENALSISEMENLFKI